MTVEWLLRALATGVLLGTAAFAAERVAGWFGLARRWTWAAALAGSLLLPLLALAAPGALPEIRLPDWRSAPAVFEASPPLSTSSNTPAAGISGPVETAAGAAPRPLPRAVLLGWLAASLILLRCLAWSHHRLNRERRRCAAVEVEGIPVRVSERTGPLVVGLVRPELLLPRWVLALPPEEQRLIVRHEREHVAAGDPWLLALATLAVALVPWNPALWLQHRRLRLALETDCDARVLAAGVSRRLYGQVLLRAAGHPFSFSVLAPAWGARTSHLERRIIAMTAKPPAHALLRALPLSLLTLGVAAAACDLASDGAERPGPGTATTLEVVDGREYATREKGGTGIMMARQEPDTTLGYTGITPFYKERPHEIRDGKRVRRRVETYPVVVGVDAGSPAERAGFRERDVLLAVNGRDMREPPSERLRPGIELTYRVRRGGREIQLRLVAAAPPLRPWPPSEAEMQAVARQGQLVEELKR
ncbi:MAG TPA: M56 family metallopeptidase [Longimicrobium sp.]|nr:M56 family metallopeptidase [Longimicrobium sp.]